jgi:hypothetical protein
MYGIIRIDLKFQPRLNKLSKKIGVLRLILTAPCGQIMEGYKGRIFALDK